MPGSGGASLEQQGAAGNAADDGLLGRGVAVVLAKALAKLAPRADAFAHAVANRDDFSVCRTLILVKRHETDP